MSKTIIAFGVLATALTQTSAQAATAPAAASPELLVVGGAPVISSAAKAQILKTDYFEVARKKRPFVRAFLQESGPTFAQYIQSLKKHEAVDDLGPVAEIRKAFEQFRTVG